MKTLPHNRSSFFQTDRYKKSVENFFDTELNNDGDDITATFCVDENTLSSAYIIAKQDGMLAGKEEIEAYFTKKFPDMKMEWNARDGECFSSGDKIIVLSGNARNILKAERVILNTLSRLSGIATTTHLLQKKSDTPLAATRKTQWSFLDKKAVFVGGGLTHRMGLFDAVLIKENHRIANGYSHKALDIDTLSKRHGMTDVGFFEVEIETLGELMDAYTQFSQRENTQIPVVMMLDNFSPDQTLIALKNLPSPQERREKNIFLEQSGGITQENISQYSGLGMDVISMGALTHSVQPIDFSLRFDETTLSKSL